MKTTLKQHVLCVLLILNAAGDGNHQHHRYGLCRCHDLQPKTQCEQRCAEAGKPVDKAACGSSEQVRPKIVDSYPAHGQILTGPVQEIRVTYDGTNYDVYPNRL